MAEQVGWRLSWIAVPPSDSRAGATGPGDWRNDKHLTIDGRTMDVMAAAHRLLDPCEPYMLLSGYRSPETNAMLRSRSSGVAKNSLHLKGQAADLRLA